MDTNTKVQQDDKKRTLLSLISIVLSAVACVLGWFDKTTAEGGFGIGMIAAFAAVLISLMSVKNHGHNMPAKVAFFASNIALFAAVGLGAIHA